MRAVPTNPADPPPHVADPRVAPCSELNTEEEEYEEKTETQKEDDEEEQEKTWKDEKGKKRTQKKRIKTYMVI